MEAISEFILYNLALGFIVFAICFYIFFTTTFDYWKKQNVPYVKPLPFFGNVKDQLLSKKHLMDVFQDIYDQLEGHKFGGYFEMKRPALMARDPDLVQKILVKDFNHFYDRGFSPDPDRDPLSANLFNLEGENWRYLRYKLTPTFTSGKLKGMFDQICKCGERLNSYIDEQTKSGEAVEGKALLSMFTMDVIATCAFGIQMEEDNEMTKQYREVVNGFFVPSKRRAFQMGLLLFFPQLARKLGIKSVPTNVENVTMKIITEVLNHRKSNHIERNDFLQLILNLQKQEQSGCLTATTEVEHDPADDVIDQMEHTSDACDKPEKVNNTNVFTDACVAAQSFVFLVAGSESVTSPSSFTLFALTQHPHIQKRVHEEIDTVLENHNNKWSYQAVKEMVYLEQVIQETFRRYPIAVGLFRICTKPYTIPDTNIVLDKGTKVFIPVHAIHNDPNNYESPEVFDPDRFVDNNFKPNRIFLPFGDGPRICIAMRFAVLEMKVVLARILSRYSVRLSSKTRMPLQYVVRSQIPVPIGGMWFEFDKRNISV